MSYGKRFAVVIGIVLLYVCCIAFQSFRTIVTDGDHYRALVDKLNRDNQEIPQVRGFIFSDNDEMLAGSLPEYDIYLDFRSTTRPDPKGYINIPADTINKYFSPTGEGSKALEKISPNRSAAEWSALVKKGYNKKDGHLLLIRALSYTGYKDLRKMPYFNKQRYLNGLYRTERAHRYRPFGDTKMAARTIGSVYAMRDSSGRIGSGRGGIELAYDSLLRGVPGRGYRQRIRRRMIDVIESEPINGANVHTTLNVEMQDILDRALGKRILELRAFGGWAAVMDVKTGQIKAISNLHRKDSTVMEDYNHLVEDLYDPGSTFKTVSYMVLLDNGKITPETTVNTGNYLGRPSDWNCHGKHIRDDHPVGTVTADEAIVQSSNIGVAKLTCQAYESNPEAYLKAIDKIGVMEDLGLSCDFPGAQAPRKRSTKERTWSKVSLGQISYGYENRIPGMYMLNFYNSIANGGKMMRPYIVSSVEKDGEVLYEREPEVVNEEICSPKTLEAVRHALRGVVEHGTAKAANSKIVTIAGKTGTAQRYANGNYNYSNGHYVSFAGFFPFEEPQYSMIVVIDIRPGYVGGRPGGGYMAGPVFRQFAEEVYALHCEKPLSEVTPDTMHHHRPSLKRGPQRDTEYLLSKLDLDSLNFTPTEFDDSKSVIPNVVGMGAEDALYALEIRGLRVHMAGMGRVVRQSIQPGQPVVKGASIELSLKN